MLRTLTEEEIKDQRHQYNTACCELDPVTNYLCTVKKGHTGKHIACGPYNAVYAEWENKDEKTN